jgi:hypothetical protein
MDDKITTWSPDTCGCIISYSWDSTLSEDERIHTPFCVGRPEDAHRPEGFCAAHEELDIEEVFPEGRDVLTKLDWHKRRSAPLFDVIVRENRSKNLMREAVLKRVPRISKSKNSEFVDDVDFSYEFKGRGANRSLSIGVKGATLTSQEKTVLASEASNLDIDIVVE